MGLEKTCGNTFEKEVVETEHYFFISLHPKSTSTGSWFPLMEFIKSVKL